jgi:GT2 family glycosyltransferase
VPDAQVSVVVVTYQSEAFVDSCLRSIEMNAGVPVQTILVDNGSTDQTLARAAAHPDVDTIPLGANRGFSAATNVGAAGATAPNLLLLNPDAQLLPEALPTLVARLEASPHTAAVGPRFIYPDGREQDGAFTYPSLLMTWLEFFPRPARLLHTRWNGRLGSPDRPIEIGHPLGACMLIRRAAWDAVGGLDEGFFMYCEEVDWCMRAKRRGWKIEHVPAAVVVHYGGGSSELNADSLLYLYASRRRLHRKHRSALFRLLAATITRAGLHSERRRLERRRAIEPEGRIQRRIDAIDQVLRSALA